MRPLGSLGLEPFEITGIGSLPHLSPEEAVDFVLEHLPRMPHWPQLPKRSKMEEMTRQFLEGMPGIREEGGKIWIEGPEDAPEEWEVYTEVSASGDLRAFAIGEERAKGFHAFLMRLKEYRPPFLKGQLIGPLTLGFTLRDKEGRYAFYDQTLREMLVKVLNLKAKWQLKCLKDVHPNAKVFLFFDEPSLGAIGTPAMSFSKEELFRCYTDLLEGIEAVKGIHVCANTDWSLLLGTGFDLLSFDCYSFGENLLLWKDSLKAFLEEGRGIAWGIVPTDPHVVGTIRARELAGLLLKYVGELRLFCEFSLSQFLITPSCGLGTLEVSLAQSVYRTLSEVREEVINSFC